MAKGYSIVVGVPGSRERLTPYSNHATLAAARKTGDKIAARLMNKTPVEIWLRQDVDDALAASGGSSASFSASSAKSIGAGPVRGGRIQKKAKKKVAKRKKKSTRGRKRKHRRNGSMPKWFWPVFVASGLTCVFFWKKANPGASLNPTV